jgi:hypothetical protein
MDPRPSALGPRPSMPMTCSPIRPKSSTEADGYSVAAQASGQVRGLSKAVRRATEPERRSWPSPRSLSRRPRVRPLFAPAPLLGLHAVAISCTRGGSASLPPL